MPWKMDNDKLAMDSNGNPVWLADGGEEKAVDYPALVKRLSEVNGESKSRKEEIRALREKYALLDGIEDLKAWKDEAVAALEYVKNLPEKDKDLEKQIAAKVEAETARFTAQLAAKDKSLGEKDRLIQEQAAKMRNIAIQADVRASRALMEKVRPEFKPLLERELVRAGALDDEDKIYYRNSEGKPFYNDEGKYATRDEVPQLILKELGIDPAGVFYSGNDQHGSGGKPDGGLGGIQTGKKYSEMTQEEKVAYLKNRSNLKSQSV